MPLAKKLLPWRLHKVVSNWVSSTILSSKRITKPSAPPVNCPIATATGISRYSWKPSVKNRCQRRMCWELTEVASTSPYVLTTNFSIPNTYENIKGKYRHLRKKLQAKGTRSAKRLLKKLSGRENRFVKDTNHCISKQIVALPFDTFVLEKLEVSSQTGKGKAFNTRIANWSWYQLEQFLIYKALLKGKKIEYVDARYTSQKCSVCGYVYRGNRSKKNSSDFHCRRCGFRCHADLNASRNIKNNYIAMLGSASHSRLLSISQTPQPELETVLS